jgi:NADH:ubiquinone oxidoreductase subunit E
MAKKIEVCTGKKCKNLNSHKQIKLWGKELIEEGKLKKVKKAKCLSTCKKGFALKFKGKVYNCYSKVELEKLIEKK